LRKQQRKFRHASVQGKTQPKIEGENCDYVRLNQEAICAGVEKSVFSRKPDHLGSSQNGEKIERLVEICNILGTAPKGESREGMIGALVEGSLVLHETKEGDVRDAALICCGTVCRTTRNGSLRRSARRVAGAGQIAKLLEEEKAADSEY
jgi:ferritin-like metal-binding protein YciE